MVIQATLAKLKAAQKADATLSAQKTLFIDAARDIRSSSNQFDGPRCEGMCDSRGTLNLSGKDCPSVPGDQQVQPIERVRMAQDEQAVTRLEEEICACNRKIADEEAARYEMADIIMVLFTHLQGSAAAPAGRCNGTTDTRHIIQDGKQLLSELVPAEAERFADYRAPTTSMAAMLDSEMKKTRYGSGNYCHAPGTVSLALMLNATSPATYKLLRSAVTALPAKRTLAAYTNLGDMSDGLNVHMLEALSELMTSKLQERARRHPDGKNTADDYLQVTTGQIQADGMAILTVCQHVPV